MMDVDGSTVTPIGCIARYSDLFQYEQLTKQKKRVHHLQKKKKNVSIISGESLN